MQHGVDAENLCGVSGLDGGLDDFVLGEDRLMAQSPMAMLLAAGIRMKQELTDLMPGLHLISCRAGRTVSAVE